MTVFTEEFIALFALTWIVWELSTHNTSNFLHHFLLKFILYLWHFDIKLWNWFWPHNFFNGFIRNYQFHVSLIWIGLNITTQSLVSWIFVSSTTSYLFWWHWLHLHILLFITHHCILICNWSHTLSSIRFLSNLRLGLPHLLLHHLGLHGASALWWRSVVLLAVTLLRYLILLSLHQSLLMKVLLIHF